MLGDIGDGTAVLAAQAQALDHPQAEQDERGGQTDRLVGRNQSDRPRAYPHSAERNEERVFAAHLVAHPSEQECPQWTDQESGGEQRDRAQQGRNRVALFEELDRQDRSQAPENIEVVPLDDVSYRRGDDHGPKVLRNLSHVPLLFKASSLRGAKVARDRPQIFCSSDADILLIRSRARIKAVIGS